MTAQADRSAAWPGGDAAAAANERSDLATFAALYDEHVAFVHRAARRLGVPDAAVEDVVQDVFIVASRKLATFRYESSLQTWLYGILVRAARSHRQ